MKHKIIFLFLALAAMIGLAAAQSSQGTSLSGSKSGTDPATKPLSPKPALSAQHKSPVAPRVTASTTSELNQLEHQSPHASGSTKGTARTKSASAPKPAAQPKSTETSTANGSGVDFKYQKPKGGMQATTPDPNSVNPTTPRVKKKK